MTVNTPFCTTTSNLQFYIKIWKSVKWQNRPEEIYKEKKNNKKKENSNININQRESKNFMKQDWGGVYLGAWIEFSSLFFFFFKVQLYFVILTIKGIS